MNAEATAVTRPSYAPTHAEGNRGTLGGIEVDTRFLPVIIITYFDDFVGRDSRAMTDRLLEATEPRPWLAMPHDTTSLTRVVGAADRRLIHEAIARSASVMNENGISAVVISNPIVRGAMTAAKWFTSGAP